MGLSLAYDAWLRSGTYSDADSAYYLGSAGNLNGGNTNLHRAVRPALLNCNKLKKAVDIPHFWVYRSRMTRWLRSGAYNNALDVYYLVASGGRNSDYGTRNYAVRPALLNCNKLKKPRISRAFGTIVRIYTAWLRSGDFNGTVSAFTLYGSGGHINYVTDRNYAVRPRFTCLRKIYCRQFPNSARSSTTEQIML